MVCTSMELVSLNFFCIFCLLLKIGIATTNNVGYSFKTRWEQEKKEEK